MNRPGSVAYAFNTPRSHSRPEAKHDQPGKGPREEFQRQTRYRHMHISMPNSTRKPGKPLQLYRGPKFTEQETRPAQTHERPLKLPKHNGIKNRAATHNRLDNRESIVQGDSSRTTPSRLDSIRNSIRKSIRPMKATLAITAGHGVNFCVSQVLRRRELRNLSTSPLQHGEYDVRMREVPVLSPHLRSESTPKASQGISIRSSPKAAQEEQLGLTPNI